MPAAPEQRDMAIGVWLEHCNPEYGRYAVPVTDGLEKGWFFFENNKKLYTEYYDTFELVLWNDGDIVVRATR